MTNELSVEDAIELLKEKRMEINYQVNGTTQFSEALDMGIKALKQQQKTGHWICHRDHCENLGVIPSGLGVYEWCSNCDCGIDIRDWQRNPHDFCPNCGADMRGESE